MCGDGEGSEVGIDVLECDVDRAECSGDELPVSDELSGGGPENNDVVCVNEHSCADEGSEDGVDGGWRGWGRC